MPDITRMDQEIGLNRQSLDLGNRFTQRCYRIRVGGLGKADVCVADLEEGERR